MSNARLLIAERGLERRVREVSRACELLGDDFFVIMGVIDGKGWVGDIGG